jgi:hypothetical protein
MADSECSQGIENHQRIIALENRADKVDEMNDQQWSAINEAREKFEEALREIGNRLPNWAVAAFTGSGALLGVLTTLLAMK